MVKETTLRRTGLCRTYGARDFLRFSQCLPAGLISVAAPALGARALRGANRKVGVLGAFTALKA